MTGAAGSGIVPHGHMTMGGHGLYVQPIATDQISERAGFMLGAKDGDGLKRGFRSVGADLRDVGVTRVFQVVFVEVLGEQLCYGRCATSAVGRILLFDAALHLQEAFPGTSLLLLRHCGVGESLGRGLALEASSRGLVAARAVGEKDVPEDELGQLV